jgi:cytochrome c peroxidase
LSAAGGICPRRATAVCLRAALGVLACWATACLAEDPLLPGWSDSEIRRILAHGPWPPAPARDPSNRVSGNPAAIAWGAALFADPRLSGPGTIACATCHDPARDFADGRARARGIAETVRNTPGLANIGGRRWYGWDGASDNLWAQSLRPLADPREMGNSHAAIAARVRADATQRRRYRDAFGTEPPADDATLVVDLAKALAAYQETLVSARTAFDAFRDALARGDSVAAARYPAAARRGARLFVGRGRCNLCHSGPLFTNGEFHDTGVPYFTGPGQVDSGRHGGIARLKASPYNLLGKYNDDPLRSTAASTRFVAADHRNFGEFKVPSLRGVARTAPYMHDGSLPDLRAVIRHYSELDENRLHADGEAILKPLRLSADESADLLAFLESL